MKVLSSEKRPDPETFINNINHLTSVTGKHYNKYEQIVLETCSINGKAANIQSQGDSHLCGMCEINNTLSDLNKLCYSFYSY